MPHGSWKALLGFLSSVLSLRDRSMEPASNTAPAGLSGALHLVLRPGSGPIQVGPCPCSWPAELQACRTGLFSPKLDSSVDKHCFGDPLGLMSAPPVWTVTPEAIFKAIKSTSVPPSRWPWGGSFQHFVFPSHLGDKCVMLWLETV